MKKKSWKSAALIFTAALLGGCGPSMGVVGMGMPMGGFAYGGGWGHGYNNVAVMNTHTTDVFASSHNNNFYHGGGNYYHPGRSW